MGCITLLSDFGLQDASVAAAKGKLMQLAPNIPIIDISHLTEPYHLQQAAYLLLSAYKHFPQGTCHVLLFDVYAEKLPRLILVAHEGHYFLAPDNGLLSLAFGGQISEVWQCFELTATGMFGDWLSAVGSAIAQLQHSEPHALGLPLCTLKHATLHWLPKIDEQMIECHVIHIDRYENVILNLTKEQFETHRKGRPFRIQFTRDEELNQISTHFHNVNDGQKLCRFNATGFLEIAINRGRAASLFGFKLYREQHLIYNSIKIFFG